MSPTSIPIWLDCDPGHDDAFAILLASQSPELNLLGISIVHGNDTVEHCALNAKRFLWSCGIQGISVYHGVTKPIVREPKYCLEIHGVPGKDGVSGMCGYHFPDELIFSDPSNHPNTEHHGVLKMVEVVSNHPEKVTIVLTGALTNLALGLRMFPKLKENVDKIVFMGGCIGIGNTGVAAEFNIEIDPEAANVVFHSGIPLVMIPLEVTHSVLVTDRVLRIIAKIDKFNPTTMATITDEFGHENAIQGRHVEYDEIFRRISDIKLKNGEEVGTRDLEISDVFSFDSPPLHDPCAVFYCINPAAFKTINVFLDVELDGGKCVGRTLCDLHGLTKKQPNATVCYRLDVDQFWMKMFTCLKITNENSPLNNL